MRRLIILGVMLVSFLGACGTPARPIELPITATSTTTPEVLADCFLTFRVVAWQDIDENGMWDASELPLEGVEFRLRGPFAQRWGTPYRSGADGRLSMTTWSPGQCPDQAYAITAVPPDAYAPTTPASITFTLAPGDSFYEAQFGFRPQTD